jgi:hypothetical protein
VFKPANPTTRSCSFLNNVKWHWSRDNFTCFNYFSSENFSAWDSVSLCFKSRF